MPRTVACIAALGGSLLANQQAQAATAAAIHSTSAPSGFDELERPRQILADIYFGDRKVGEAMVLATPGTVRFLEPAKLLTLLPDALDPHALMAALSADLPSHPDLVCSPGNGAGCGQLSPATVGVIFDESRFRADIFLSPAMLRAVQPSDQVYLKPPSAPLSLTSAMGFALSGSSAGAPSYNVQNRTILAFRNARIRSDSSYASHLGVIVDDLVAEMDSRDLRYSGGLFWAPGLDLTGHRRIAGVGLATQFDTRADRERLEGTPLILFLQQPARVEMIVDGRIVTSRAYGAGNNVLDTSELSDGSYPILLRIREQNGMTREERRFFVKNAQIAPVGEPLYFGFAGLLANTRRDRAISLSRTFYYQLGTARRLNRSLALDLSALGAGRKNMVEAGAWLLTRYGRMRVAGLVATSGDHAAFLQLGSSGLGSLNLNLDVRRVWSSDGAPLVPLPAAVDNFGSTPPTGAQVGEGSYTQVSGSVGYTLGTAYLSAVGSLRRDRGIGRDYTIGPSVSWPILSRGSAQLVLQADAQRTRTTTAAFIGFRAQFTRKNLSVLGTLGHASRNNDDPALRDAARAVGSLTAEYFHQAADRTQVSASAGFDRNLDSSEVHAAGAFYSRLGSARGDLLHPLSGEGGLQYGLTLQTGAAIGGHDMALGGRDLDESALLVSLGGERGRSSFDVLVDEQPRGRVGAGRSLPLFLQPYREYSVRLRPIGAPSVDYDGAPRPVTLYPGNVETLRWVARSVFTVFGQALRPDGRPVANATIQSQRGIGESDEHGYFQIDVAAGDMLSFDSGGGESCRAAVSATKAREDFVPLGKVICR
ncbi:CS1-pili formation C-terminal domain-containing protein [Sphingomonas sp. URHD0057]|uniref:CS1-pili formation C-terminal domain-containing protein n=1 Tax=Sphingomonas sp. URHD0057 TaxID=1380389 RepID=UPI00048D367D|nr:CS1-pili formation C-terminal domain-containing protein [Sphingomonas sp. URHD0057]